MNDPARGWRPGDRARYVGPIRDGVLKPQALFYVYDVVLIAGTPFLFLWFDRPDALANAKCFERLRPACNDGLYPPVDNGPADTQTDI